MYRTPSRRALLIGGAAAVSAAGLLPRVARSQDGRDARALVIDVGSGYVKAGFSGQDSPTAVFSAIVGRPRQQGGSAKDVYVGEEALSKRATLRLRYPIERGVVTQFDDFEGVLRHTLYNELRVAPEEHPVLLAVAPLTPPAHLERLVAMLFETFGASSIALANTATLAVYSSGRTTGLVLASGDGVTHAVPIRDGRAQPHASLSLDFAGRDVTDYLNRLLVERGASIGTTAGLDGIRDIKEKLCYVAEDFDGEMSRAAASSVLNEEYELPGGQRITIGNERFRAPEALFAPSPVGVQQPGVHHLIHNSIAKCDADVRKDLYGNIVLAGGNTIFGGFDVRVTQEVTALAPPSTAVKVTQPSRYAAWIGGSIVSSRSTFEQWFTKAEYDQDGPAGYAKKLPF